VQNNNIFYIASDHAGFILKEKIINSYKNNIQDLGCFSAESVDYPDYAHILCDSLKKDPNAKGILICYSGIGMSIVANRYPHIRAALCSNIEDVKLSRQHNDANILILAAKNIDLEEAICYIEQFNDTKFENGRHLRRIKKMEIKI
jgi:ribose 5-phosphate isomerase B